MDKLQSHEKSDSLSVTMLICPGQFTHPLPIDQFYRVKESCGNCAMKTATTTTPQLYVEDRIKFTLRIFRVH